MAPAPANVVTLLTRDDLALWLSLCSILDLPPDIICSIGPPSILIPIPAPNPPVAIRPLTPFPTPLAIGDLSKIFFCFTMLFCRPTVLEATLFIETLAF